MNKTLTLIFLCFVSLNCFGQELRLSRGTEEKKFKKGSIFEIVTTETTHSDDRVSCKGAELIGKIISISADSLTLQLSAYKSKQMVENVKIEEVFHSNTGTIETTIAHRDIIYLKNYKTLKQQKKKASLFVGLGGVMFFTGAVTALNAFVVNDKSNINNLLISGGAQFGLGIGFMIAGNSKKYSLSDSENNWTIKK